MRRKIVAITATAVIALSGHAFSQAHAAETHAVETHVHAEHIVHIEAARHSLDGAHGHFEHAER
jgi:hypothetical protein